MVNVITFTSIFISMKIIAISYEMHMPLYSRRSLGITNRFPFTNLALRHHIATVTKQYPERIMLKECPVNPIEVTSNTALNDLSISRTAQINANTEQLKSRRMINYNINPVMKSLPLLGKLDDYLPQNDPQSNITMNKDLNLKLDSLPMKMNKGIQVVTESPNILSINSSKENAENVQVTTTVANLDSSTATKLSHNAQLLEKFSQSLDIFERKFYQTTFSKLSSISPPSRRENGMSYVQSGLFLQLALMALSTEVSPETKQEIDDCLGLNMSDQEKLEIINVTLSSMPASSDDLKFRWSSRLVLRSQNVSQQFKAAAALALHLQINSFNGTETPKQMADALNHMVEMDSGGAIHNTFDEEELSGEVRAILVGTLYMRARWRSAPTLLNGTREFHDAAGPRRATRMIRINDNMRYARLDHWDAEALEIFYSTPGLSLVLLVPRGNSLRRLAAAAGNTSVADIAEWMRPARLAVTLPLYTLRMTLLLPNKLQAMNIKRLVEANNGSESDLRLSNAVQRIMFWAEAGRNAFKDDGLEWDEPPQQELIVDRPYLFFVRWKNKTIMNGNFVL